MPTTKTQYQLDQQDRITDVNFAFIDFANNNDWPISANNIINRSLFDFIDDPETRYLTTLLLKAVRETKHSITLPFRCDNQHQRLFMSMHIEDSGNQKIQFTNTLIKTEERPVIDLRYLTSSNENTFITLCSWCNRFKIDDQHWAEIEEAVNELDLFTGNQQQRISHGICEQCRITLVTASNAR